MADPEDDKWSTLGEAPPPKKRKVPIWLLGCGIGCGLFVVLGILGVILLVRTSSKMVDPEVQWAALAEYLEVAERPDGYMIHGNPEWAMFPLKSEGYETGWNFIREDQRSTVTLLVLASGRGDDSYELAFDEDIQEQPAIFQSVGFHGGEAGVLTTQGQDLRTLRYTSKPRPAPGTESEADPEDSGDGSGLKVSVSEKKSVWAEVRTGIEGAFTYSAMRVDLTENPAGGPYLILEYRLNNSLDPIDEADVVEFLGTFDLGASDPASSPASSPDAAAPESEGD